MKSAALDDFPQTFKGRGLQKNIKNLKDFSVLSSVL